MIKVCRYDKESNPNSCGGCEYGCIERKPATINKDFEDAIKDMVSMNKKTKKIDNSDLEMDCLECDLGKERACSDCCRDWDNEEED